MNRIDPTLSQPIQQNPEQVKSADKSILLSIFKKYAGLLSCKEDASLLRKGVAIGAAIPLFLYAIPFLFLAFFEIGQPREKQIGINSRSKFYINFSDIYAAKFLRW